MKRRITIILLLLLSGAIVNVAVAWGAAGFVSHPRSMDSRNFLGVDSVEAPRWYLMGWSAWGTLQLLTEPVDADHPIHHAIHLLAEGNTELGAPPPPSWSRFYSATPDLRGTLVEDARGWPLLSLRCEHEMTKFSSQVQLTRFGIPLSSNAVGDSLFSWASPRALPWYPVWSGFIINTLFYALLLWLHFFGPFAARRMLRRRRGQCEQCAYPIGVSPVCTECGAAVSTSVARSSRLPGRE